MFFRVEEDFDRLQEDLVLKIVEEPPKMQQLPTSIANIPLSNVQPPPNLITPLQDKWYYQDPQGDLQGPFSSTEMAEWFQAGYFSTNLLVRRPCDERFFTLGDLVAMCNGNPFQSSLRIPPLKQDVQKLPEDLMQLKLMQTQFALRQPNTRAFNPAESWQGIGSLQQRELFTQQLLSQTQVCLIF